MSKHKDPHHKHEHAETASSFSKVAETLGMKPETTMPVEETRSIDELETALDEAKTKAQDSWDKFVRTQAEMDNLRKRVERDIANAHKYALEKFVNELLPVLDSFEQGLQMSEKADGAVAAMREGMELTHKMLLKAMEKFGVEQINPLDQAYDPHQQEAMSMVDVPGVEPNTVIQVIQKGYQLHGRLVRPARVIISK
jgi:molecular chaperone GrpE